MRTVTAVSLGFICVSLTVCSSRWVEAGGCLQFWDLWGRLLHLLALAQAACICWTETCSILSAKASEVMGGLVCGGLEGLHLLPQCKFFIPKVILHSQYNENGVSEWIFVHENLWYLRECFSSALESVCVYSSTCLLDVPGSPAYEQVLGPVVNLGLGSVELLKKKKKKFFLQDWWEAFCEDSFWLKGYQCPLSCSMSWACCQEGREACSHTYLSSFLLILTGNWKS